MALTKLWLNITLQITSLLRVYMPDSKCISKWGKGDNVLTCQICPTQKMAELKYETKSDESWKLKSLTSMLCINMKYKRCLKKKKQVWGIVDSKVLTLKIKCKNLLREVVSHDALLN